MHSKTYADLVDKSVQLETRIVCSELVKPHKSLSTEARSTLNLTKDQVVDPKYENGAEALCQHLWRLAQYPPERTRESLRAQLRAIDTIARLRGFIK